MIDTTKEREFITQIEATGNYKVFESINLESNTLVFNEYNDDEIGVSVFIDIETTGLNHATDEIIELGMFKFEYSKKTGMVYKIIDKFDELQEPSAPISAEISEITGITNEMVSGKNIDLEKVSAFVEDCQLIIAHNAGFDRKFMEAKFPIFAKKPWACSLEDIGWDAEGFRTKSLEFLAFKLGFVYDAHRAAIDCLSGITLLSKTLPKSNITAMKCLLDTARKEKTIIKAVGASFASKDILKNRGYRWNGEEKVWWTMVLEEKDIAPEIDFLEKEVYAPSGHMPNKIPVESVSFMDRFSIRETS